MNKRLIYVLIFAIIVSGAASFILYRVISTQMAMNAKAPGSSIVVAARNLEAGALIKADDVKVAQWDGPKPEGSFTAIEKKDGPDGVLDRGVVHPIFAGEPVTQNRLAAPGAGAGLAAIIPPGMRAVAVRVNEVVGVAGFATPGMHVDVLVSGNPPGPAASQAGTLSRTLLQDIEVLSAGQNLQKDAEGKAIVVPVVNLLVTPAQAEVLSLAGSDARIQLSLRNPIDKDTAKRPGTALAYIFEPNGSPVIPPAAPAVKAVARVAPPAPKAPAKVEPAPAPVAAPPEKVVPPITIEVIHGSKRTESKFAGEAEPKPASTVEPKPAPVDVKVGAEGGVL